MKEVSHKLFLAIIIIFLFLLEGCASKFNINPTFKEFEEPPIVGKIDAKVGVFIPDRVHSYIYSDKLAKVAFGESSSSRILEVSSWIFVDNVQITGKEPWKKVNTGLDGFLELQSVSLNIGHGILNPFVVEVKYKICFYNSKGTIINCWDLSQKVPYINRGMNIVHDVAEELIPAIEKAVRGVIAKFIVAYKGDPLVQKWASNFSSKEEISLAHIESQSAKQLGLLLWNTKEKTGTQLEECEKHIIQKILEECPVNNINQSQKIRDFLYPYAELETVPSTENGLISLIMQNDINKRLINHNIRLLALIYGVTIQEDPHGFFGCGAMPYSAGCVGFAWGDENTQVGAIILDLQKLKQEEWLEAAAKDTSWALGFGLPIWHTAQTEKKVCKELGTAIGKYFREKNNNICRE